MPDRVPILLDTDIGTNIDDAFALAYLLCEPRCDLLGITTVSGDVSQRAALAQALCDAAGSDDVPVHCGAREALLADPGPLDIPQYQALAGRPHRSEWPSSTAVDFLRARIRSRPGEITLLSIGPLTNLALLFALDPETPHLLESWVSMAGNFWEPEGGAPETNARTDPIATAMAFRAPVPRHVHLGWDVTSRCRLPAPDLRQRFEQPRRIQQPLLGLVMRMAEHWRSAAGFVLHDPLAAAVIFEPSLCTYARGRVTADAATGRTAFEPSEDGPDEVATNVDTTAFFQRFFAPF